MNFAFSSHSFDAIKCVLFRVCRLHDYFEHLCGNFNGINISIYRCLDWTYVGSGCVGAKDDSYLDLKYFGPSKTVTAVKLVHTSGTIKCTSDPGSNWGCKPTDPRIGMVIRVYDNNNNNKIIPRFSMLDDYGFYRLPGYNSMSHDVILRAPHQFESFELLSRRKIRVWYGEDLLRPDSEHDNSGKTCFKIYID